jgi:protein-S-isoprenylcysteine O-methyltransferase Ste14
MLWLRTLLFTVLVPGTVLVLFPGALLAGGMEWHGNLGPARWFGFVPVLLGLVVIVACFVEFIRSGRGTPAPYDPPQDLVVVGLYRHVRNPQYVGVLLVSVGEAVLAESAILLGYSALLAVAYHLIVRYYEEPTLGRLFGESYAHYWVAVPRWVPRWHAAVWKIEHRGEEVSDSISPRTVPRARVHNARPPGKGGGEVNV